MIYQCIPKQVERIWGSLPSIRERGEPVGEIWWFHEDTILKSKDGTRCRAADFFTSDSFPVILKTLHSTRDLSVQVHPGRNRKPPLKDESWAVLEGYGKILHGITEGVSPEEFADSLVSGKVETLLDSYNASPGDLFHLPAGTVHALGGGLTVLEIQLNCTITYRLWDYGRRDSAGNLRELHIEDGLEAIDWSRRGRALQAEGILEAESYSLHRRDPGTHILGPLELVYDHQEKRCLFTGPEGGRCETTGETWIVRIQQ